MSRRWAIGLLVAVLSLPSCRGEELPPGAEFLRFVQRDADLLLYVDDLLPHLLAALESEAVVGMLQDVPMPSAMPSDPARLRLRIEAAREFLPARVCLSVPPGGMKALGAVWRALEAGTRCNEALGSGGAALRAAQEDLAVALADLQLARASVWVAFRDPRTAESLFDRVLDMQGAWAMNPAIEVEEELDALELRLHPGGLAGARMFPRMLSRLGVVASREDPGVDVIREAVAPLHARIAIELAGDALVCTLGAMNGGSATDLTSLWGNEPLPVVYLQWDLAAFCEAVPEPVRTARTELSFWPLLEDLLQHASRDGGVPATGALRVDVDGRNLVLLAEHLPPPDEGPLFPPELLDALPAMLDVRQKLSRHGAQVRSELRISLPR